MQILSDPQKQAMELASEKGASTWLTTLPVEEFGFTLHKNSFHDGLALRYRCKPNCTPQYCACTSLFSVEHALSCPKGGFPTIRHNKIREMTASLLSEVVMKLALSQTCNLSQEKSSTGPQSTYRMEPDWMSP